MRIARRLFVVPLANDRHGKSSMINAVIEQGSGTKSTGQKGARKLVSPWGREIDAYIFIRSYQEAEKGDGNGVVDALNRNDPNWRTRELIIFSSHVSGAVADIDLMIEAAHEGGFDVVCATVLFGHENRANFSSIWKKNWDERWTIPNPRLEPDDPNLEQQLWSIGSDLWTWICETLAA